MDELRSVAYLIKLGQRGSDATADLFLGEQIGDDCKEAKAIYESDLQRMYLEAALLATEDFGRISEIFGFRLAVVELYERAFFRTRTATRMQKLIHIDSCKEAAEQNMKRWGFTQGIEFLAWRMGAKVEMVPVQAMQALHTDCYFKAKEAFFNPNSAEASKEALKWVKQASELSRILKAWVSNNQEAMQDIELALATIGHEDLDVGNIAEILSDNGEEVDLDTPGLEFKGIDDILSDNSKE